MALLRKHKLIITFLSVLVSFISFGYILLYNINSDYEYLWILPLCFALLSPFLINGLFRIPFLPFILVFYIINFFRYVFIPFLTTWKNYFIFRSPVPPTALSIMTAELVMAYELAIICIFLNVRKVYKDELYTASTYLTSEKKPKRQIYYIFILFAVLIYIAIPDVRKSINILSIKEVNIVISPFILLLVMLVILAKNLTFVICLQLLYEKKVKGFLLYFLLLLLLLLNISIYYGSNRSDFLLSAVACIYTAYKLYPKQIKYVGIGMAVFVLMIFGTITTARNYYRVSSDSTIVFIDTCQAYAGSLYNVAISIETAQVNTENRNLIGLSNDFLRSTFGINMIMKQFNIPLSNDLFNARMYLSTNRVFQIMPMIGQGYFYFGFFLSPLLDIIFLELAFRLIRLLNRGDFESKFFLTITCTRLGFLVGQNSQIQMNDLSFNLFLFFFIWWINKHIYVERK